MDNNLVTGILLAMMLQTGARDFNKRQAASHTLEELYKHQPSTILIAWPVRLKHPDPEIRRRLHDIFSPKLKPPKSIGHYPSIFSFLPDYTWNDAVYKAFARGLVYAKEDWQRSKNLNIKATHSRAGREFCFSMYRLGVMPKTIEHIMSRAAALEIANNCHRVYSWEDKPQSPPEKEKWKYNTLYITRWHGGKLPNASRFREVMNKYEGYYPGASDTSRLTVYTNSGHYSGYAVEFDVSKRHRAVMADLAAETKYTFKRDHFIKQYDRWLEVKEEEELKETK